MLGHHRPASETPYLDPLSSYQIWTTLTKLPGSAHGSYRYALISSCHEGFQIVLRLHLCPYFVRAIFFRNHMQLIKYTCMPCLNDARKLGGRIQVVLYKYICKTHNTDQCHC